jgi:hypothetical protein
MKWVRVHDYLCPPEDPWSHKYSDTDKMLNDKDTEVMRAMLSQVSMGHEDQMSA